MDLDLHVHSNVSDGTLDPSSIVAAAAAANLDVIALADHDTVLGVAEAAEAARRHRVEIVPAIEVSTTMAEVELHILGYFVDPSNAELLAHVDDAATRRQTRLQQMVERLSEQDVDVSFEAIRTASPGQTTLGRPHLARAMVEAGYVNTTSEAFDLYIGNSHAAYIPTGLLDPSEAIELIEGAGGIPVWAHPPIRYIGEFLPGLLASGLRGLEVYRPRTQRNRVLELERTAKEADLLLSGGSDWHGPDQGPLGEFRVDASEVSDLLAEGGI